MENIPTDNVGAVVKSPRDAYNGWSLRISKGDGGYYVYYIRDLSNPKSESYDGWFESWEAVKKFFEKGWEIHWVNK